MSSYLHIMAFVASMVLMQPCSLQNTFPEGGASGESAMTFSQFDMINSKRLNMLQEYVKSTRLNCI